MSRTIAIILLIASTDASLAAQILEEWTGVVELTIGDDESLGEEYLLGGPTAAVMDNEGRIYLVDYPRKYILVYDRDGSFLRRLGSDGDGPGEFREIRSIGIDRQGRIVVPDRMSHRITLFDPDGQLVAASAMPIRSLSYVSYVAQLPDRSTLFLYTYPDREQNGAIFPIRRFSADLSEELGRYGRAADYYDVEDRIEARLAASPIGTTVSGWEDTDSGIVEVFAAPRYYEGSLMRYRIDVDGLVDAMRFEGDDHELAAFEEIPFDEDFRNNRPRYYASMSGPEGTIVIDPFVSLDGIFRLSDGRVLAFLTIRRGNEQNTWVDVFGGNGSYMGRHPLRIETPDEDVNPTRFSVLWSDSSDRFLVAYSNRAGAPVLSVVRIDEISSRTNR